MSREEEIKKEIERKEGYLKILGEDLEKAIEFSGTKPYEDLRFRKERLIDEIPLLKAELKGIQEGKQERDKEIEGEIDKFPIGLFIADDGAVMASALKKELKSRIKDAKM